MTRLRSPFARIREFILRNPQDATGDEFDALARELFAYQYARNPWVRRLADASQTPPHAVTHWHDIPAMPGAAFKAFALTCVPKARTAAVFHSSGTTGAQTSRHFFSRRGLALYETSLRRGFDIALPYRPPTLWAVMPAPFDAPHSSLSHMLGTLGAERFFWNDNPTLSDALANVREPITLFGTAFALLGLLDATTRTWTLPPGSLIIETGGFKGRTREVSRADFYETIGARFGLPADAIHSEYGMSEMASQFYGHGASGEKRGPHWTRSRAIDPQTGRDAPAGQPGALRHLDLANLNSACVLQTSDWGSVTDAGIILHGRAEGADLRGCSLTAEELWPHDRH